MNFIKLLVEETSSLAEETASSNTITETTGADKVVDYWNKTVDWLSQNGIKLLIGLATLAIAWFILNVVLNIVRRRQIKRKKHSPAAINAIVKTVGIVLKICLVIAFLSYVGVETAGVGAILSGLSVIIGLAVQGALANVAGGVVIVAMRPFKVDDFIEAQGYKGTVEIIHLFYTNIITPDNKKIMIPNGALANGVIVNYSSEKTRRVDIVFPVSYETDVEFAKSEILKVVKKHKLVLKDPIATVRVSEYADSSINIVVRAWVKTEDYWTVYFDLMEQIKARVDETGIEVPFNQLDVHIVGGDSQNNKKKTAISKKTALKTSKK